MIKVKYKINEIEFYASRLHFNEKDTSSSHIVNNQRYNYISIEGTPWRKQETITIQHGHASLDKVHKVETPKP